MVRVLCSFLIIFYSAEYLFPSVELKDSSGKILGEYSSIQAAYNIIPDTVSISYIIELLPEYKSLQEKFPIIFYHKYFNNDSLTITIRPGAPGIIIEADTLAEVFRIDSASNIIIDGRLSGTGDNIDLKIGNHSTGNEAYSVNILNSSSNITLKYLQVFNNTQSDTLGRNICIGWSEGSGNRNISIVNCLIEGGRSGVLSLGNSAAPNTNIIVKNCEIKSFGWVGVKIFTGTKTMTVEDCTIYQTEGYNVYVPSGISISGTASAVIKISGNKIYNIQSSAGGGISMRGIYVFQSNTAIVNIENNFISLPVTIPGESNNVYGIVMMGDKDYSARVINNSIYIGGTHYGGGSGRVVSAGIMKYNKGVTGLYHQLNNIIVNKRSGGNPGVLHAASVISNASPNRIIDFNTYYTSPGEGKVNIGWDSLYYNDITEYQSASGSETNSYICETNFKSETDLHIPDDYYGEVYYLGTAVEGIVTDIDRDIRNQIVPYRGADELLQIVSVRDEYLLPDFAVSQNFPNPFNPSTTISYRIKTPSVVTIKVFDIRGKEVVVLLNEYREAGSHNINFSAGDLASGVYFYRIQAGDFTGTRKMIFLK